MTRFLLLVLILSLVYLVKLFEWNPRSFPFEFLPGRTVLLPEVALMVLALVVGAAFILMVNGVGDAFKWFRSLKNIQEERTEEKVEILWKKIREELNRSHTPQAITLLDRLVAIMPNHTAALFLLGNLKRQGGDLTGAIRIHRRARVFDEEDVRLILALANDYDKAGRLDDELALYREYFKKEGKNALLLGSFRNLLVRLEKWDEALDVQSVLSRSFQKGDRREREVAFLVGIKYESGRQLVREGKSDAGRRLFRSALKINHSFVPARISLSEAQDSEGRGKEALETLLEGWSRDRDMVYLDKIEELALDRGNPDLILSLYERLVQDFPDEPAYFLGQARLLARLMMVDEAIDLLESIDGRVNWDGSFHRLRGELYLRKGDQGNALEAFRKSSLAGTVSEKYFCRSCETRFSEWDGRCPSCRRWNTMTVYPGYNREDASILSSPGFISSEDNVFGSEFDEYTPLSF